MRVAAVSLIYMILLSPAALHAQQPGARPSVARKFVAYDADVSVRSDGWIEVTPRAGRGPSGAIILPPPDPPNSLPLANVSAAWTVLFSPDELATWLSTARRVVASSGPANAARTDARRRQSFNFVVSRTTDGSGAQLEWQQTTAAVHCNGARPPTRSIADTLDTFFLAIDSAVTIARSVQSPPRPIDASRIHDNSEVSCAAWAENGNPWPILPTRIPRRFADYVFDFVVTNAGRVDTSSVRAFSFVPEDVVSAAKRALAGWRYRPAFQGVTPVTQRIVHTLRFADSARTSNITVGAYGNLRTLIVRDDGWISVRDSYEYGLPRQNGLIFSGDAVNKWLADMARVEVLATRDSATSRSSILGNPGATIGYNPAWTATLGRDSTGNIVMDFSQLRGAADSSLRLSLRSRWCSPRSGTSYGGRFEAAQFVPVYAGAASVVAAMGGSRTPDTTAIHEADVVACSPVPRDSLAFEQTLRLAATVLDRARDHTVSFVVNREGEVERSSAEILGVATSAIPDSLSTLLAALRFRPAFLGPHNLRHRSYALIPAAPLAVSGSQRSRSVCVSAEQAAVRVNVISPESGAPLGDLNAIAAHVLGNVSRATLAEPIDAAFRLFVDWRGIVTLFSWLKAPEHTSTLASVLSGVETRLVQRPGGEPLGLEVYVRASCA